MSKADQDNRSNQLNPNNDAYWSSRSGAGGGGDDDENCGHSWGAPAWTMSPCKLPPKRPDGRWQETFLLDFVTFGGLVLRFKVQVEFDDRAAFASSEVATDFFEEIWRKLTVYGKAPLAFGQLLHSNGKPVQNVGFTYVARRPMARMRGQVESRDRLEELWATKGSAAVGELRRMTAIESSRFVERQDYGTVTEEDLRAALDHRPENPAITDYYTETLGCRQCSERRVFGFPCALT